METKIHMEWGSFWLSVDIVRMSMHHASEDRSSVSCHASVTLVNDVTTSNTAAVRPCSFSKMQASLTVSFERRSAGC